MNKEIYFAKIMNEIGDIQFIYMKAHSKGEVYLLVENEYPSSQILSIGRIQTYKGYKKAIRYFNKRGITDEELSDHNE